MDEQQEMRVNRYLHQHVSIVGKRLYEMIKEQQLTKTDLRKRVNLPAKQLDDELKKLAGYNLIKSIKKPEKKNLNVWVLFHEKEEEEQEQQKIQNQDLIALILKKKTSIAAIKKEAVRKNYSLDKFDQIMEMLEMRGQIIINDGEVELRELKKIQAPCITCELRRLCSPGGAISPEVCPYLINW